MPRPQQRRVALIVEDEALLRVQIMGEFQANGWTVLDAASGETAVGYIADHPIDFVFTDIQLAGSMCGWEVAEKIRASAPGVPVVYTSGNAAARSRQVPESLFFDKPYDPADVVAAAEALASKRSEP
jgi:CheY-like chemotaxis protein